MGNKQQCPKAKNALKQHDHHKVKEGCKEKSEWSLGGEYGWRREMRRTTVEGGGGGAIAGVGSIFSEDDCHC